MTPIFEECSETFRYYVIRVQGTHWLHVVMFLYFLYCHTGFFLLKGSNTCAVTTHGHTSVTDVPTTPLSPHSSHSPPLRRLPFLDCERGCLWLLFISTSPFWSRNRYWGRNEGYFCLIVCEDRDCHWNSSNQMPKMDHHHLFSTFKNKEALLKWREFRDILNQNLQYHQFLLLHSTNHWAIQDVYGLPQK